MDQHEPSRTEIWKMFDQISPTYDRLNKLLSFGLDSYWRHAVKAQLPYGDDLDLLDVATGTGDQTLSLIKTGRIRQAVGIDMSQEMLNLFARKVKEHLLSHKVQLEKASALAIPFADSTFDVVTISFGIRNVTDLKQALQEMRRVLKPTGRLLILEFSQPSNPWLKRSHLFYLRHCLPRIAGLISQQKAAYTYLNRTIETFPYGQEFIDKMEEAGFVACTAHPLTFGVVSLYVGHPL